MMKQDNSLHNKYGALNGALAFTIWGLLPLYWKLLKKISPVELLAHRILWSFVFMVMLLLCKKSLHKMTVCFRNVKDMILTGFCALLICINWLVYIWAVNSGHVLEASMGYYMNPLIAVFLGVTVFREKLPAVRTAALILAAAGILIQTFSYGKTPWISILLAVSFAAYGALKKSVHTDAETGIAMETFLMTPFALGYICFRQISGSGVFGQISLGTGILLICSGAATAAPLLMFSRSTKMIKLSTVGFLQYISPTISFLLGILVFHEQISPAETVSFTMIWLAVALFLLSELPEGSP